MKPQILSSMDGLRLFFTGLSYIHEPNISMQICSYKICLQAFPPERIVKLKGKFMTQGRQLFLLLISCLYEHFRSPFISLYHSSMVMQTQFIS